jgi:hypothetical protein
MPRNRFDDALAINCGAVNISGIANSIVDACRACRDEGEQPADDVAIRLMIHQLAHLTRNSEIANSLLTYRDLVATCEARNALEKEKTDVKA